MHRPSSELALSATPGPIAGRARMPGQKRGVREEVGDAVRGERLLEAGGVRALGQPDAGRIETGEAARRAKTDPELRPDRRAIKQWQGPMGRGRREDLDVTGFREVGERADEVTAEACSVGLAQPTVRADI